MYYQFYLRGRWITAVIVLWGVWNYPNSLTESQLRIRVPQPVPRNPNSELGFRQNNWGNSGSGPNTIGFRTFHLWASGRLSLRQTMVWKASAVWLPQRPCNRRMRLLNKKAWNIIKSKVFTSVLSALIGEADEKSDFQYQCKILQDIARYCRNQWNNYES